ncbi:hypothetical protein [Fodinibius roseus]|uniref:hypothetical protein n=1 Tax=Fodinibius roseus TaxID=1194090 RepID=UPI0011147B5C|nr:hypothetical protein [Fodinibius roseus]
MTSILLLPISYHYVKEHPHSVGRFRCRQLLQARPQHPLAAHHTKKELPQGGLGHRLQQLTNIALDF